MQTALSPIYLVAFKMDRTPTEDEAVAALHFFIDSGALEPPPESTRYVGYFDAGMNTRMVEGTFLIDIGRFLLQHCPELQGFMAVTETGFTSSGLDIKIVGHESAIGYCRVVRIFEMRT